MALSVCFRNQPEGTSYRLVYNPLSSREPSRTLHEPIRLTAAAIPPDACLFRAFVNRLLCAEASRLARLRAGRNSFLDAF